VVHGRPDVRVTHQLLLHTNRSSLVVEDCPVSVPEGIPAEIRDANRLALQGADDRPSENPHGTACRYPDQRQGRFWGDGYL
jgi:hypothetical protein